MLRYPNLHTSLGSTLAGSTVRIDEEGSSSATVKRWHLKSRRAYLVAATLVIIGAGSFLWITDSELLDPSPRCAQYRGLYRRDGERRRERRVQWKCLSSGSMAGHERHPRTDRYHPCHQ